MLINKNSYYWYAFVLLAIAIVVRFIFFFVFLKDNPCMLLFDSKHYHDAAVNILNEFAYVDQYGNPFFYRLPGYPIFIAFLYYMIKKNIIVFLSAQIFVSSIVPLLFFLLAHFFWKKDILFSLIVGFVAAIHPGLVLFSGLVFSDMLFLIFWLISLLLFFYGCECNNIKFFMLSGFCLGFSTLIRPVVPLMIFFVISILWKMRKKFLIYISTFLIGWIIPVGMWICRNYIITGYLFLHTLSGSHFLNHGIVRLLIKKDGVSHQIAQDKAYGEIQGLYAEQEKKVGRSLLEIEKVYIIEHAMIKHMLNAPLQTLLLASENMVKTMFSLYSSELLFIDSAGQLPPYSSKRTLLDGVKRFIFPQLHNASITYVIWYEIIFFFFLLFGFLGFIIHDAWWQKKYAHDILFSLMCILFFIAISFVCGFARLRLPIEPFIIIWGCRFWYTCIIKKWSLV